MFNLFKPRAVDSNAVLETRRLGIKGMNGKGPARTVLKALLTKPGVVEVHVNRDTGVAEVTYDTAKTDLPTLEQVILRKGYAPSVLQDEEPAK